MIDEPPIGGSTGLCHVATASISEAARWYAENSYECPRPVIPNLKRRFGLTTLEAMAAMDEGVRLRGPWKPPALAEARGRGR